MEYKEITFQGPNDVKTSGEVYRLTATRCLTRWSFENQTSTSVLSVLIFKELSCIQQIMLDIHWLNLPATKDRSLEIDTIRVSSVYDSTWIPNERTTSARRVTKIKDGPWGTPHGRLKAFALLAISNDQWFAVAKVQIKRKCSYFPNNIRQPHGLCRPAKGSTGTFTTIVQCGLPSSTPIH